MSIPKKLALLVFLLPLLAFEALAASVSPGTLILIPGQQAMARISGVDKDSLTTSTGGPITGTKEGRLLASNCFQCHGTYGSGGFEKLLGESEAEIYEELLKYQDDPDFTTNIMAAHLQGYTDAQMQAIAKYLAKP